MDYFDPDLLGLLLDKPEPHLAEEDTTEGDKTFSVITELDKAYT
jgi:hypothetical protein